MKAEEFVKWVEGYYSPYPPGQKEDIAQWTIEHELILYEVRLCVRETYSSKWGKPPDIAVFNDALKECNVSERMLELEEQILIGEATRNGVDPWTNINYKRLEEKGLRAARRDPREPLLLPKPEDQAWYDPLLAESVVPEGEADTYLNAIKARLSGYPEALRKGGEQ